MRNPTWPHHNKILTEALEYKDLEGLLKPTIHIDEFSSKMGDDEDILVLSFFVRDQYAAKDLVSWFEKGYDFVLDADRSPGEIKPNRYLVYVEMRRRSALPDQVAQLLDDLQTLTEFSPEDWSMVYKDQVYHFDKDNFAQIVPLTPKDYRMQSESALNEMRVAAGLDTKKIHHIDPELRNLQWAAGI